MRGGRDDSEAPSRIEAESGPARAHARVGPLVFGLANQMFGSLRPALLSLIFFFVVGLIILPFVNVDKAIADVKAYDAKRA